MSGKHQIRRRYKYKPATRAGYKHWDTDHKHWRSEFKGEQRSVHCRVMMFAFAPEHVASGDSAKTTANPAQRQEEKIAKDKCQAAQELTAPCCTSLLGYMQLTLSALTVRYLKRNDVPGPWVLCFAVGRAPSHRNGSRTSEAKRPPEPDLEGGVALSNAGDSFRRVILRERGLASIPPSCANDSGDFWVAEQDERTARAQEG
ncbi:hypothetical protein DFH09DRAFT_1072282 [Mycena vulgaris]|nr:hypothetical protein DFH09DRAFT_1072282 [Mycena vulgaris]